MSALFDKCNTLDLPQDAQLLLFEKNNITNYDIWLLSMGL